MLNRRIAAATVAASIALSGATVAYAGLNGPTREHAPRTCDFERTWAKKACTVDGKTFPWLYSKAQEAAEQEKATARTMTIARCKSQYLTAPVYLVKVKKGDTLWGLATKHLGTGYGYKLLKHENRLTSNTLRVGQILAVTKIPAGCAPFLITR